MTTRVSRVSGDMEEKLRFTRETLSQFHTLEDVAMFATTMLFSIIPTDKVALTIMEGDTFRSVSTIGEQGTVNLKLDQPSVHTRTVKTGHTQLVKDTRTDPDHIPTSNNVKMLSEMCVPMVHEGQVLGAINFENMHPDHFSEKDAETVEAFTNEIAEAIHRVNRKKGTKAEKQNVYQIKNRSVMDRYHDILKAVNEGETVLNRILNRTVIPWKPGKDIVNDLVTKGYLTREKATARRYAYRITEEGLKALKTYEGILKRLGR
jgi:predicted transcriptional regulator